MWELDPALRGCPTLEIAWISGAGQVVLRWVLVESIAFGLVTFYVPPLWGSLAMRWLRRNAYV